MIKLRQTSLPPDIDENLKVMQKSVDKFADYPRRVIEAKAQFSRQNKTSNAVFSQVRRSLTRMCSGARRCVYCEDSCADEVEHIKPKDLYPDSVFLWENYVYACGPCNGPKNNKFSVFAENGGQLIDVTRKPKSPVLEPERGAPALINPRWEDPLKFMQLDLLGTFIFLPLKKPGSRDYERAQYTIELLRLNDREVLIEARHEAFDSYRARLQEYIHRRDKGNSAVDLKYLEKSLKRMQHPTVWKEMKRQSKFIPLLDNLFSKAPEALRW
jgi:uncharacterized protein (TIGR02646 family)